MLYSAVTDFFLPSFGSFAGLYYGIKHGKIARDAIWNMTGVT